MEESEYLIAIAKNLDSTFLHNGKVYYKERTVWPFRRLEPHQVRYLLHKEIEDKKEEVNSLGRALF